MTHAEAAWYVLVLRRLMARGGPVPAELVLLFSHAVRVHYRNVLGE